MSHQATAWAARQKAGDVTAKAVLYALANYANHQGLAYPSVATIQEDAEIAKADTVRGALKRLEARGLILRVERTAESGRRTTDEFRLLMSYPPENGGVGEPVPSQPAGGPPSPQSGGGPSRQAGGREQEGEQEDEQRDTDGARARAAGVAKPEDVAAEWMHAEWERELGQGRQHELTQGRRKKYRAMFSEQLKGLPDPALAFRCVLRAVKLSPHHMSNRAWQMPESLFRNPERRDTWVEQAVELIEKATRRVEAADDFAAAYRARKQARSDDQGS